MAYGAESATIPPRVVVEPNDMTQPLRRISAFSSFAKLL
jgi:hypothetical protein